MSSTSVQGWRLQEKRSRMSQHLYMVEAQLIPGLEADLLAALDSGQLARGKTYEQEMQQALRRARLDGRAVRWVEACHCASPLAAERHDLDQFFIVQRVKVLPAGEVLPELAGQPLLDGLRSIVSAMNRFTPYAPKTR